MVQKEMQSKTIKFNITGVKVLPHQERSERKFWLVAFAIDCDFITQIRKKLNLSDKEKMNYHLTLHEKEIFE